ncbi:transposase [Streptomyces inhibens]|uniref:transposase n=1 Tax=Streptomyces inhibens TaxID=2293571 RepID=UPI0037986BC1
MTDSTRDILGLWVGDGGEGAKYRQHVLTAIKNRGVTDIVMVVCDGLKELPESVAHVWPQAVVRTCVTRRVPGEVNTRTNRVAPFRSQTTRSHNGA